MRDAEPIARLPRLLVMTQTNAGGAMVFTERDAQYFTDPSLAWSVMAANVDPRLNVAPLGNC